MGILLAIVSGICNGLFTTPMKMQPRWKWENLWLVFIVVACLAMPVAIVTSSVSGWTTLLGSAPSRALTAALAFGFAWGFGAISFGQSVDSLGVSVANSLVIGLSSALGSLVPLFLGGKVHESAKLWTPFSGIGHFSSEWCCAHRRAFGGIESRLRRRGSSRRSAVISLLPPRGSCRRFSISGSRWRARLPRRAFPWDFRISGRRTASGC